MIKRPLAIVLIGWLFIAVGAIALRHDLFEFKHRAAANQELLACLVNALAIVAGAFLLRGCSWARWLLVSWMVFHVILSLFHSIQELTMHVLIFGILGFFLFYPPAQVYFRRRPST